MRPLKVALSPPRQILAKAGEKEHAIHTYLNALRYKPDDVHAHKEIFATVHAVFELSRSLQVQLNHTRQDQGFAECAAHHRVDPAYQQHKGLPEVKKVKYIREYAQQQGSKVFIETGTWYGETLNAVKGTFERLVSVEVSEQIADLARKRFEKDLNIQIIHVSDTSPMCTCMCLCMCMTQGDSAWKYEWCVCVCVFVHVSVSACVCVRVSIQKELRYMFPIAGRQGGAPFVRACHA